MNPIITNNVERFYSLNGSLFPIDPNIKYDMDEPTSEEIMSVVETSGSFDFWNNPEEDVYNLNDGEEV